MKKKIFISLLVIVLFSITGCGLFKEKRTIDYLMKGYVKAYVKADLEATKDIFPKFYLDYNKKYVTQESLDKELANAKERYGDDFNITYKVDKEVKFTDEELKNFNKKMKDYYKAEATKECYKYEGNVTLKGSKKTDSLSMGTIARCNYDGTWYLLKKIG